MLTTKIKIAYYLSLIISKSINKIITFLHLGSGYTWPGHFVLKIFPNAFFNYSALNKTKCIFISGTNGKTTTSRLLSRVLVSANYKVVSNTSGANLLNGIVSALYVQTPLFKKNYVDFAVLEVDEFSLPLLLENIKPALIVLLNLSRDQLDRYGEVDIVLEKWKTALLKLDGNTELLLDGTQPYFKTLADSFVGKVSYFDDFVGSAESTKYVGSFNYKNINAALSAGEKLGVVREKGLAALENYDFAYGRGESIVYKNKNFRVFLAKNPASFNNNLDLTIDGSVKCDTLLFILNDDPRDGRDVSWIYDIESQKLNAACKDLKIYVSGKRFYDFALRLHYADISVDEKNVVNNLKQTVEKIVENDNAREILILPNYSSMLEVRKILIGREIL